MPKPVTHPHVVRLPDGSYHWEPDPAPWRGYRGKQQPYRGPDRTCASQRAAAKYPNRAAAEAVARTIPGAVAVPYTRVL